VSVRTLLLAMLLAPGLVACNAMSEYSVTPQSYSGVRLYQVFCASCHGLTGHGDGPVQPSLKVSVPDLTRIAERHGGVFPREPIREIIDGRTLYAAHGARTMPVWGFEFLGSSTNDELARREAQKTVDRLVRYLETLQPDYDQ
jgi:mono/diheme cytochrome c family protein